MQWLNYHHLYYFWVAAQERSVTRAARRLRLAQPTVSEQIRKLEEALGAKLFERTGRELALTDAGRVTQEYADEIFSLGQQLLDVLGGKQEPRRTRLVVGVTDSLPKLVVYHLLEPALRAADGIEIICREGRFERLVAELAVHTLDLVLADAPLPTNFGVKAFSHLLGQSDLSFFAAPRLHKRLSGRFPANLNGAPLLFPAEGTALRRALDAWLEENALSPKFAGEFEDRALAKAFGMAGAGVFVAPTAIESEVKRQYDVTVLGRCEAIQERFYAISLERRIKHPGVAAISAAARKLLP
ncbi:MAG TPA: transcriptional activator NhaR [Polyangiaceae bacterium]|nr:transcriptional activator NhaR [Polyangiaceae bacterium]